MTAAERRIGAILARALHPSTPPAEARVRQEKLEAIRERGPVLVEVVPGLKIDLASIEIMIGGEV